jgi:hypothetical protein
VYCIAPEVVNPNTAVASVTVDWDRSIGNNILATWGSNAYGCPAGQFSVRTFTFSGGTFVAGNNVAFSFVIP